MSISNGILKKSKISQAKMCEVLLDNYLTKDLQIMLLPLNVMQSLFLLSKYRIRDNFITPNGILYNFVSFLGTLFVIMIWMYQFIITILASDWDSFKFIFYVVNTINSIFYTCGYILIYCINVARSNDNVILVLRIQSVLRNLNIDRTSFKSYISYNWIYVICLNLFYLSWVLWFYIRWFVNDYTIILLTLALITFDMNIIYAIQIVKLICLSLREWIEVVRVSNVRFEDGVHSNAIFNAFINILEAYKIIGEVFQGYITFYLIDTFCHTLMHVEMLVDFGKNEPSERQTMFLFMLMSIYWVMKNIVLQVLLSFEIERLYTAINEAISVSVLRTKSARYSVTQRRMFKNIERVHEAMFGKMCVYGLFTVDATLPLRSAGLISTYTIVLLQFAFL